MFAPRMKKGKPCRQSWCDPCHKAYRREYYLNNKQYFLDKSKKQKAKLREARPPRQPTKRTISWDKANKKKNAKLGMNAGTASHRLVKDLLFKFISEAGHVCFRCGEPMTRETFSIEHKDPWLNSADPIGKFFDLENIAFSHRKCNSSAASASRRKWETEEERLVLRRATRRAWQRSIPAEIKREYRRKYRKVSGS